MRVSIPRRRRRGLRVLAAGTAVAMCANVALGSSGSDVLARCEALETDTAVLTEPTASDVPSDVASTLSAYPDLSWSDLDDAAKVGLLWAHGYVYTGGSDNGGKAGSTLLEVYTRCSSGDMADVEVTYDAFTGDGSECEAANCGSYFQATNADCLSNVTTAIQCAVDGASASVPAANGVSFWSSAASTSAIPYPQVFQHSIALSDEDATLKVFAIHMRSSDSGTSCSNTLDAIIPCLRLADVTASTSSSSSSADFCRPTVDTATVNAFLSSLSTVQVDKESTSNSSGGDSSSNSAVVLGLAIGGGVAVLVVVLVVCCCCCKKRNQNGEESSGTAGNAGNAQERTQNGGGSRAPLVIGSRAIGRRGKSNDSSSDGSSNAATNVNTQNRPSRRSWYTFGNGHEPSNRNSTLYGSAVPGRRSSMGGTWMDAGGGKSVSDYCNESETLTAFMQDPEVFTKRIAFDELTFLRMLSKGAYGEVWLGQLETRHVAIKRLLPEKCQFTASLEQFAGEIGLMCTLQHRNIVSFVGVSWNRLQNLCAVVEYMEAGDLDEVLKKYREKFSWQREKISIAMDIAEGLVYLHCLRPVVVHRDLKSKNVLLNRKFHAKLSDFGVSRKTTVNETMTSGVGTLLWTAPEIIEGKKYSEKADIYSLGVVLSELDTCEPPFADVTTDKGERLPGMQLAQLVRLGKIRVTLRSDCPPSLRKLAMDCTQLDPDLRPSSMQVAFTLKSIIAPTLRLTSSTATTASTSSVSSGHGNAAQALQRPSSGHHQ
ncbi:hypothetical protein BBJ28_00018871 [Nothophytophthora sp. Chile5]|nr:hypothetical protein BBJ28_00018871 [Nothophytophthora sp. Chile5]